MKRPPPKSLMPKITQQLLRASIQTAMLAVNLYIQQCSSCYLFLFTIFMSDVKRQSAIRFCQAKLFLLFLQHAALHKLFVCFFFVFLFIVYCNILIFLFNNSLLLRYISYFFFNFTYFFVLSFNFIVFYDYFIPLNIFLYKLFEVRNFAIIIFYLTFCLVIQITKKVSSVYYKHFF